MTIKEFSPLAKARLAERKRIRETLFKTGLSQYEDCKKNLKILTNKQAKLC